MSSVAEYITANPNSDLTRFAWDLHLSRPCMSRVRDRRKGSDFIIDSNQLISLVIEVMVLHRVDLEDALFTFDTLASESESPRKMSEVAVAHVREAITRALPTEALKAALLSK